MFIITAEIMRCNWILNICFISFYSVYNFKYQQIDLANEACMSKMVSVPHLICWNYNYCIAKCCDGIFYKMAVNLPIDLDLAWVMSDEYFVMYENGIVQREDVEKWNNYYKHEKE